MNYEGYIECKISDNLKIEGFFTFFRSRYKKDFVFNGETHNFTEVVCVLDGNAGITAGNNVYTLYSGQMVVHPPNRFHKIRSVGTEMEVIIFSFSSSSFPENISAVYELSNENVSEIKNIYKKFLEIFNTDDVFVVSVKKGKEMEAGILLKRIEIFLLEVFSKKLAKEQNDISISAKNYISIVTKMENLVSERLTVTDLAKHCKMSVPSLEKTVKKYSGKGAMEMFCNIKIKAACEMLKKGQSVKDITYSLGFSNQCYFSEVFKKKMGIPPSKYSQTEF